MYSIAIPLEQGYINLKHNSCLLLLINKLCGIITKKVFKIESCLKKKNVKLTYFFNQTDLYVSIGAFHKEIIYSQQNFYNFICHAAILHAIHLIIKYLKTMVDTIWMAVNEQIMAKRHK